MEDRQIVELFNRRSEDALAECQGKYGRYLESLAMAILEDRSDAEEAVNDLWLRVWNAIPPANPENLKAYLARILRNLALDRLRQERTISRSGGQIPLILDELEGAIPDPSGDPARQSEREDLSGALDRFLEGLPVKSRRIFMARYWYMRPIAEIAGAMGMGESAVKMSLLRAKRELKDFLEKEGITL